MLSKEWTEIYYVRKLANGSSLDNLKKQVEEQRRKEEADFWERVERSYQRLNKACKVSSLDE